MAITSVDSKTRSHPAGPAAMQRGITERISGVLERASGLSGAGGHRHSDLEDFNFALDALKLAYEDVMRRLHEPDVAAGEMRLLFELTLELQGLQHELQQERLGQRLAALANVQGALGRLREARSLSQLLDNATTEVCRSCGFDRAIVFRVNNSQMIAESTHFEGDAQWADEFLRLARDHQPQLNHLLLETEMIRRRAPMLVTDAQNDPRTFKALIGPLRTSSYVAAPIMPEGRVIGFLHADRYFSKRPVDTLDRDALWTFAEGFGHTVERAVLLERLNAQRDRIRLMMESTEAILDEFCNAEVELIRGDHEGTAVARTAAALVASPESRVETLLTHREYEVLGLMANGATNAQIASRLVISEGTVKSHVKHILRKLGAANRAEAVSRYLRMQNKDDHL